MGAPGAARQRLAVTGLLLLTLLALAPAAGAQNMESWYRDGMAHLQAGRKAEAQAAVLNVLAEVPDHFRSMVGLARLYLDTSPSKALEYANTAIRLAPSYEVAHLVRGQALERLGREEDAADAYRQVIRIDARNTDANNRLRALLRRMQDRRSQVQQASERFWADPNLRTLTLFGQILLQQAKPDEALTELDAIRKKRPDLPEVNLWIARARRAAGDVDGEQAAYRQYLAVRPSIGVRLIMAERLEAIGRYRDAMAVLTPIEADKQTVAALDRSDKARLAFLRSRSLLSQHQFAAMGASLLEAGRLGFDPDRVTAAFREDLSLFDNQAVLWQRFADWYRLRNNPDEAAAAEAQACHTDRKVCDDARKNLEAMRGNSKTLPSVLLALGDVALTQGNRGEALTLLQQVPPGPDAYGRAQLLIGLIYRAQGDTTKAVDSLMRYVFLFPDRNGMLYARGTLFWEMGERDVAVAVWKEHPAVLAEHPDLLARLALHLHSKNDPGAELLFREQLAKAQPELSQNQARLGDLYSAQNRPQDAQRAWQAALKLRPRDTDLLVHVARAYLDQGNVDDAVPLLRQAWQMQSIPPELAVQLAQQLEKRRQPAQALEVYVQVQREAPGNPAMRQAMPELALSQPASLEVRRTAASIALETDRPKLAENLLVAALMEAPNDPDAREALAAYYRKQGQPGVADRVMRGDFRTTSQPLRPVPPQPTPPASVAAAPLTPAPSTLPAPRVEPPQPQAAPESPKPAPQVATVPPAPVVPAASQPAPPPLTAPVARGVAVVSSTTPGMPADVLNYEFMMRRNPNAPAGSEGP
ncbi:MAG TPA: tetratricopeptide repeat protein [bacterium]